MSRTGAVVFGLAVICLAWGCRGRAEFRRGEEALRNGDCRLAYYHFWNACRENPAEEYRGALRAAGRRVAEAERARGLEAESGFDLPKAVEIYSLALQYDPDSKKLQEDYDRVSSALTEIETLDEELRACRDAGEGGWREGDLLLALARHPRLAVAANLEMELRSALVRAVDAASSPLRVATFESPLPQDPAALDRLAGDWLRLQEECVQRIREEEAGFLASDARLRELAAWGISRDVLTPCREQAGAAGDVVLAAREGSLLLLKGEALERSGDLSGALDEYRGAIARHPDQEEAKSGRARVHRRLVDTACQAAHLALKRRDLKSALAELDRVLALAPDHGEAIDLRHGAREELANRYALEARRFEESGLQGNALVRYYLALELEPSRDSLRQAVERYEAILDARLRPRIVVRSRSVDAEELRVRKDLWNLSDDECSRVGHDIEEAARERLARFSQALQDSHAPGEAIMLLVEDVDLSCEQNAGTVTRETARYVESLYMVENPDRGMALKLLEEARRKHEDVVISVDAVPAHRRQKVLQMEPLARLRAEQAESLLGALPESVSEIGWGKADYSKRNTNLRLDLAARYRLDGESRWVAASLAIDDGIVVGDPSRNISPDPEEKVSRSEALRILAPRLGAALGEDVEAILAQRHERYYREAMTQLAEHSFDLAVENLVVFLHARGDPDDTRAAEAARKLEDLTGCDLLRCRRSRAGLPR